LLFSLIVLASSICLAQTSAFTYQGKLGSNGAPANGDYQFEFKLFDAATGTNQIGTTHTATATVQNGSFSTRLDFGTTAFAAGQDRWLEISVRLNGGDPYTVLSPRQQVNSAPFAVRSVTAASADSATTAGTVTGVVAVANGGTGSTTQNFVDLTSDQTISGNKAFNGTLSGNGSGLTSLNGANLSDGSITKSKLAPDYKNGYDPQLVALMRWDLLPAAHNFVEVGRQPSALAFDGTFMYVANKGDNNVTRIRTSTGLIEGTPIAVGTAPSALAYDGKFMWVANSGSNDVTKIRARTGVVEGSPIAVGNNPQALAFDGTFLYVANSGSDSVTRIRVTSGAVEGSPIEVGDGPFSLVFAGGSIYVAHQASEDATDGYLKKIRASTGTVEGTITHLWGALAFDGTFVYVAMNGAIQRIRASTGVREFYGINGTQFGLDVRSSSQAICFDGTSIFVAGRVGAHGAPGAEVMVLKANVNGLGIEGGPVPVLGAVKALAFDGTYVYAANELSFTGEDGVFSWVNGNVIRFQ